ncbi:hypothetical protein [Acrocarpospora sp. B8E8]|uniref:hypothetical protein n=1 Tax=Acrocarpospora sp. B8E8 TaxID=3153572 RepID=UPI00325C6A14
MDPVLCGLAANPALPVELVDRLIAVADEYIAADLADREGLSRAQAVTLASRVEETVVTLVGRGLLTADDIDPVAQPLAALALLAEGTGRPEWARLFAADPDAERREKLAACPGLPPDVMETLAADSNVRVVAELGLWTTADMAVRLAGHPHAEVRRAVAANEATPPAVLAALITGEGLPAARWCLVCDGEETPSPDLWEPSCDGSHESTVDQTRQAALWNPATPAEAVIGFADDPSMQLRWPLAIRPDLPPETYERLADSPEPVVRAALAENPAIPDHLVRALATDPSLDVRRNLAANPHVPLEVLTSLAGAAKVAQTLLPRIAAASPAEVGELANSPDPAVRMLVAQRRDLPAEIRDMLAADADAKVLKSIAPHPGLSEAQLRAMADRHGVRVLAKVATNPDASPALLETLTQHQPPVQKVFREVAQHSNATATALLACLRDHQARRIAAGHPSLPSQTITDLLADEDWQVAESAAANPSLPLASMSKLVVHQTGH